MHDDLSAPLDELPLLKPGKTGKAPRERLTKASHLRDIFTRHRDDDRINAFNRAQCQSLLDGEPPYDQGELDESGQPDATNLNFQGAEQRLERAKAPYYRLIHSSDTLLTVKTLHGAEDERPDWESILAEEISKTIRRWSQFPYQTERLIHKHVWEGIGIAYWPDDMDWRFRSGGLGQFYFPRQAHATETENEVITCFEEYTVTRLYRFIEDPENAEENGWNVEAVRKAIEKATTSEPVWQDWERLMDEAKNNDLSTGSKLPKIEVIHGFVEEFDGTVSHYMTTEHDTGEKFLYRERGKFKSMTEALVIFPYTTGNNNKIHGIRGLGYKIFPMEQQRNRSICRLIDKGIEASSLLIQAEDENALASLGMEYVGNMGVLSPNTKLLQPPVADLQRSVIPAIDLMDRMLNDRMAGYSEANVFDGDQRKTKAEVLAHLEQSAALTESSLDFFYGPWRRVLQQIVRRMIRKDYTEDDAGGKEVVALRKRLERRGVPKEAFFKIDWEETLEIRVIGSGSAAAKSVALERGSALYPRMDDKAKAIFNHQLATDIFGTSFGTLLFPADGVYRTTLDTQVAILQNAQLLQGNPIPVLSSDKHLAHAREHIKPLMEMYQAAEGGQMDLADAAVRSQLLYAHTVEHVQMVEGDEGSMEEAKAMAQLLQQIGEVIHNGLKEAEARQQEAAQAEAEAAQAGAAADPQGAGSVEENQAFAKAQAEIEMYKMKTQAKIEADREASQVRQQLKIEEAQTANAIKDASAAAEIVRKRRTQGDQPTQ